MSIYVLKNNNKENVSNLHDSIEDMMTSAPLMTTSMELQIPLTLINPNLDEIQSYFAQVLNNITDMTKDITMWGQRNLNKKDTRRRALIRFNSIGSGIYDIYISLTVRHTIILFSLFSIIRGERREGEWRGDVKELLQECLGA